MTGPGRGTVRLSSQGFAVLQVCAASPLRLQESECDAGGVGGAMYVAELIRLAPGRPAVARASVSRTLRRLWCHGWIELASVSGWSLTAKHADADAELQAAERDPEGTYATAKAYGGLFLWQSPAEYLAYLRRRATQRVHRQRMAYAQITSAGRERLTSGESIGATAARASDNPDSRLLGARA